MQDLQAGLARWGLAIGQVREQLHRAPTPRERERWHARWLRCAGREAHPLFLAPCGGLGSWWSAGWEGRPARRRDLAWSFTTPGGPQRTGTAARSAERALTGP